VVESDDTHMTALVLGMGLVALIMTISALASGIIDRAPLSFPIIFLGLGFLLGGQGLGIIEIDSHSPLLEAVATISLCLVLFLDAVKIQIDELRHEWYVPVLTLGPGTILVIGGIAVVAYFLLPATPLEALLLGAILASTDPVVLRDVIRDERIPRAVRRALGIEAGMNDVVVLPIVLILIAFLNGSIGGWGDAIGFLGRVLILSPLVGLGVGYVGARLMGEADRRYGIRKEYQALYGIGLVLATFFVGTALGGDGFLAAFFAGLAVTMFNVSLCECFMDYGEVTSEMMMLFAFVLFGALLSTVLPHYPWLPALALAVIALGIIRPVVLFGVLQRASMSNTARLFIGWFGPRGLNSLLLALLAVQAAAPTSERAEALLAVTGVVVIVSVIAHGVTATPISARYGAMVAQAPITPPEERENDFQGLFDSEPKDTIRITPAELVAQLQGDNPPLILDVRARGTYFHDAGQIPDGVRVLPDDIGEWADSADPARPIVAYCTCPDEAASARAARYLNERGFMAKALQGGYRTWEANYPIAAKVAPI
jgi:NhaP-type Na+/H+ or K+/H+ antiporter/rhodanese-related sulfurtransferase